MLILYLLRLEQGGLKVECACVSCDWNMSYWQDAFVDAFVEPSFKLKDGPTIGYEARYMKLMEHMPIPVGSIYGVFPYVDY